MIRIGKGQPHAVGNEFAFGLYWDATQQASGQPAFAQPQQFGQPTFGQVQQPHGFPQSPQAIPGMQQPTFDLDFWVLRLYYGDPAYPNGRVRSDDDVVYHGDRSTQDGTIQLSQDNRDGNNRPGLRDDEFVVVRGNLGACVARIFVAIHDGEIRGQHFGQLSRAGVNVYPSANFTANPTAHFDLDQESRFGTVVGFGDVVNGQFTPYGHTYRNLDPNQPALPQVLRAHGVNV
jgi:stress response protein SCP2